MKHCGAARLASTTACPGWVPTEGDAVGTECEFPAGVALDDMS